jgi:hypothetical protein
LTRLPGTCLLFRGASARFRKLLIVQDLLFIVVVLSQAASVRWVIDSTSRYALNIETLCPLVRLTDGAFDAII